MEAVSTTVTVLGLDVGTTHCKAGVFDRDGALLAVASRPTATYRGDDGHFYHDPEALWATVTTVAREALAAAPEGGVEIVGIGSMAEAGLLVDRENGRPRTPILPWWDTRATEQAERIARGADARALFQRRGLHPSFKFALPKLLWLRARDPSLLDGAMWLSVADYIVFRLTGRMATDPTLAARTYGFDISRREWDTNWLGDLGFARDLFPPVLPSGEPAGQVTSPAAQEIGLALGTPAAVSGHDHVCTLLAAGITAPGQVLDSIGTAESLLGVLTRNQMGEDEYESGLAIVPHVLPDRWCWLGGLSAAGGSIEWLRSLLGEEPLPYDELHALLDQVPDGPTGILYFPYLSGSGAPRPDGRVRGAFAGLSAEHGRSHLLRAVLEGTAYEAESIRRAAERMAAQTRVESFVAAGGGARNKRWLQIKADVSGCRYDVPFLPEATALGAALTAALGAGLIDLEHVERVAAHWRREGRSILPDPERHAAYQAIYKTGYLPMQEPLRQYAAARAMEGRVTTDVC